MVRGGSDGTRRAGRIRQNGQLSRRACGVLLLACLIGGTGCAGTPRAFGSTLIAAREHSDSLLTGLERRFTRIKRSPEAARSIMSVGREVFTPSRVFGDTSVWSTVQGDSARQLVLLGHVVQDQYVVTRVSDVARPDQLAASRDEVRLQQRGHEIFQWNTVITQALGTLTVDDVDRLIASMLTGATSWSGDSVRTASVAAFPQSSAVLSRLFSLDTLQMTPSADSTTAVTIVVGVHPDRLRATHAAFATYLRNYLGPTHLRGVLRDSSGDWVTTELGDGRWSFRFHATHDGHFAPLTGVARPMPDSLTMSWDFRTKVWLFSIGTSDLSSDFIVVRAPHVRGWRLSFRHEPRWHLPLAVGHFVKSSLQRPFMDGGAYYSVAIVDSGSGPAQLERSGQVVVQEGTVMRWLGSLGARALGEFSGPAESDEDAYLAALFAAARDDVRADLGAESSVGHAPADNRGGAAPDGGQ